MGVMVIVHGQHDLLDVVRALHESFVFPIGSSTGTSIAAVQEKQCETEQTQNGGAFIIRRESWGVDFIALSFWKK
jgi:S-ribosylhomocysteine lyase LuxS involved in autoinducer biosynthesis